MPAANYRYKLLLQPMISASFPDWVIGSGVEAVTSRCWLAGGQGLCQTDPSNPCCDMHDCCNQKVLKPSKVSTMQNATHFQDCW